MDISNLTKGDKFLYASTEVELTGRYAVKKIKSHRNNENVYYMLEVCNTENDCVMWVEADALHQVKTFGDHQ